MVWKWKLTYVELKLEELNMSRLVKLDILQSRTLKELKLQVLFQGLLVYL